TERESVFSKILYTNSSFNRSITKDSKQKEVNFLIRTLEENKKLHKEDIVALMTKDISKISKGYLSEEELKEAKYNAEKSGFIKRKYNQVGYLWNILSKLDDLDIVDNYLYFKEDAPAILVDDSRIQKGIRDAYLHRIYKNQLQEESYKKLGDVKCMLEKLSYPSLVASHIVPFISASSDDKYNSNNGLLLSRNMDLLFDQGYISFKESGIIILSDRITTELKVHLNKYSLDSMFINDKRKTYMNYHRNNVFK
ncbi:MAG: restriction endonuclease, partial [Parcubacteria group bacterium CG1_02_41_12]